MATETKESSSSDPTAASSSSLNVCPSESSSEFILITTKLTDVCLSGANYFQWRCRVEISLMGMELEDHLTTNSPNAETNPGQAKAWVRADARLYTRLLNSMDSPIADLVTHCLTVREISDYLALVYSGKDNMNRLYDVSQSFFRPQFGESSLGKYFASFKRIYEEFNILMPITTKITEMQQQREQLAIISFLSGLPPSYDSIRSQILASRETSLAEAFSRANRAIRSSFDVGSDRVALVSSGGSRGRGRSRGGDRPFCTHCQCPGHVLNTCYQLHGRLSTTPTTDSRPLCSYCKAPGHTRDRCFKLHGRPSTPRSANVTTSGVAPTPTDDGRPTPTPSPSSLAPSVHSTQSTAYLSASPRQWIIDTGVSDHMTGSVGIMHDYSPTSSFPDVRITDGTYIPVKGIGIITLTPTLTLQSVLYLPALSVNLLSVSALTRTHRCHAIFSGDSCIFQDPLTRKTIGRGRRLSGGLYVLEAESSSVAFPSVSTTALDLYCRFGHPTLSSLKLLCSEV
ncbi:hypothetical protein Dimus_039473 [Dionaea muscipula]